MQPALATTCRQGRGSPLLQLGSVGRKVARTLTGGLHFIVTAAVMLRAQDRIGRWVPGLTVLAFILVSVASTFTTARKDTHLGTLSLSPCSHGPRRHLLPRRDRLGLSLYMGTASWPAQAGGLSLFPGPGHPSSHPLQAEPSEWRLATLSAKGQLCWSCGLCLSSSTLPLSHENSHRQFANE